MVVSGDIRKKRLQEIKKYNREYYEKIYWKEDFGIDQKSSEKTYNDPKHKKRFEFLFDILHKTFSFGSILDVGCGTGTLLRNLLNKGYYAIGTEISEDAMNYYLKDLHSKHRVILCNAISMPFNNNSFDIVFSSDVLEHILIEDIPSAVNEFTRITKKLIVMTINLHHKYEYHPTILTREEWDSLFLERNRLVVRSEIIDKIHLISKKKYPEYDFFVYEYI